MLWVKIIGVIDRVIIGIDTMMDMLTEGIMMKSVGIDKKISPDTRG